MPANPLDPTTPTGSSKARLAQEELRAIKAKLVEHETAVTTTLPQAIEDVDTTLRADLTQLLAYVLKLVSLSGSGTFEVPLGVTKLFVFMRAGGQPGCKVDRAGGTLCYVPRADNPLIAQVLTVTPGQVLSYSVGATSAITARYEPSTPGVRIDESTQAGSTTFGSLTVEPQPVNALYVGNTPNYPASYPAYSLVPTMSIYNTVVRNMGKSEKLSYPYPKLIPTLANPSVTPTYYQPDTGLLLVGW